MIVFRDAFAFDVELILNLDIEFDLIDGTRMKELSREEASCFFELIGVTRSRSKNRNLHSLSPQLIP